MRPRSRALWRAKSDLEWLTDQELDEFLNKIRKAPELSEAFGYFGLNPTVSGHREILLILLATEIFRNRNVGRTKGSRGGRRWNEPRLLELAEHYGAVVRDHPKLSDVKAAREIRRRFKKVYRDTTDEVVRQRLPEARRFYAEVFA
jgi:hypothetical protein